MSTEHPRTTIARAAVLPFTLERDDTVIAEDGVTTTSETVEGLLRLERHWLVVQWRLVRTVDRVGAEIRSDRELGPVREVTLALTGLATAAVRTSWWPWSRASRFVLTAADLRTFEPLAGADGLQLDSPAELVVDVRPQHRLTAQEFAADLQLAIADPSRPLAERADERLHGDVGRASLAPPPAEPERRAE